MLGWAARAQSWKFAPNRIAGESGAVHWRPEADLVALPDRYAAVITPLPWLKGGNVAESGFKGGGRHGTKWLFIRKVKWYICWRTLGSWREHIPQDHSGDSHCGSPVGADNDVQQAPLLQLARLHLHLCHSAAGLLWQVLYAICVAQPAYIHYLRLCMDIRHGFSTYASIQPFWNPNPPTHRSTIQTPFLRFMFIFNIILMITKVLISWPRASFCYCSCATAITTTVFASQWAFLVLNLKLMAELRRTTT